MVTHLGTFFKAKIIVYSDDIYIKTIYLVSRTDLIHMLCD